MFGNGYEIVRGMRETAAKISINSFAIEYACKLYINQLTKKNMQSFLFIYQQRLLVCSELTYVFELRFSLWEVHGAWKKRGRYATVALEINKYNISSESHAHLKNSILNESEQEDAVKPCSY
eukprot:gb/GEZJ01002356.1/.p3 GENE.gb/GEZJ01002356.1/~~gb/GEZJ01002356.1/.p3  ORF type:complete len:122 (-),score=11.61 gb/GEZJ01002356.1/:142-507(-)